MYLKIDQKFVDDKFILLEKQLMINSETFESKVKKFYTECPYVHDSLPMKNFIFNQKYNKQYSTEFINLSFNLDLYKEYMEYTALYEFNKVKAKEFIPFTAFSKVYREAA